MRIEFHKLSDERHALELVRGHGHAQQQHRAARQARGQHQALSCGCVRGRFQLKPGDTPIVPIMLGDAKVAVDMANKLLDEGIYVIGFSYSVVPKGQARIRVQLSAGHSEQHIDQAIAAFTKVGKSLGVMQ